MKIPKYKFKRELMMNQCRRKKGKLNSEKNWRQYVDKQFLGYFEMIRSIKNVKNKLVSF